MDLKSLLSHAVYKQLLPPQLKDDGDFARNTYIDTLGLSGLMIIIQVGALDEAIGSTAEDAALKLEECDTSGGSYTAITGAALSAVIPAASGDDKLYAISVDLTKTHKRFIQVNAPHVGNGTEGGHLAILAIGFPADVMPNSAAEMGLAEFVQAPAASLA